MTRAPAEPVPASPEAMCCIVGAGPAGAMLALLLARAGIPVTLLEAQLDFDREFRGDTINPAVMEIMDQLGLADRLLELPHARIGNVTLETARGPVVVTDYRALKSRYPYIVILPQARFLKLIISEAQQHPHFHLRMGARVQELIHENGRVRGVRYRTTDGGGEVRALLTVGADGRFSRMRKIGGFETIDTWPSSFDVLWLRLPRDPRGRQARNLGVYFGRGYYIALTDRGDHWQIAYMIPKGTFAALRAGGLESLRRSIVELLPELRDRVAALGNWSELSYLAIQMSRVRRWYRDGLLLIGDAAHVMSSVGGVGINCAIQDAVVAANGLIEPLRSRRVGTAHLAAVQRRREWPTRIMQCLQFLAERQYIARALDPARPYRVPWVARLRLMQRLTARIVALGPWRVRAAPHTRRRCSGGKREHDTGT